MVHLVDAGGNIVISDSSTVVEAFLAPSLGQTSHIVIDTRNDAVPRVVEIQIVRTQIANEEFVPGDVIVLKICFSDEVIVSLSGSHLDTEIPALPTVELNIFNAAENKTSRTAHLVDGNLNNRPKCLYFEYAVVAGDLQSQSNREVTVKAEAIKLESSFTLVVKWLSLVYPLSENW